MSVSGSKDTWDGQLETLDDLSEAIHYNQWIFGMMKPHLGDKVIEIGCGIGNMTGLLAQGRQVLGIDIHPGYVKKARLKFKNKKNIFFRVVDMGKKFPLFTKFKPDTIVCINVFEHIQADRRFLKECFKLLPSKGRILIFVPALPALYGSMDSSYGHFRRYDKGDLVEKMEEVGFTISKCRYLNLLGVFGWWWNGKILRKPIVPKAQILIYDKIIRWIAPIEKWLPKPIGLSLFCAGAKD